MLKVFQTHTHTMGIFLTPSPRGKFSHGQSCKCAKVFEFFQSVLIVLKCLHLLKAFRITKYAQSCKDCNVNSKSLMFHIVLKVFKILKCGQCIYDF